MRQMAKLPEGRKPLPKEWFIDRAKNWGDKPKPKEKKWKTCVSCGGPAQDDFCGFCLEEE